MSNRDKHLNLIHETCEVLGYHETPKGHYLIWYDDQGFRICETDFKDYGESLEWSCETQNEFEIYCKEIEGLE